MKLILSTLIAASLTTSAFAGNSDRYNDNKFNTAVGHVTKSDVATVAGKTKTSVTFSTRDGNKKPVTYPYINPYGIGPSNDSR